MKKEDLIKLGIKEEAALKILDSFSKQNEELEKMKNELEGYKQESKRLEKEHLAQIQDIKMDNAIKLAIANSAHDVDLVASLIDKSALSLDDKGGISGIDEQLGALKENKGFLFKESKAFSGLELTEGADREGGESKLSYEALCKLYK